MGTKTRQRKNRQIAMEREEKRRKRREESTNEHESCTKGSQVVHDTPPNHKPITNNQEPVTSIKEHVPSVDDTATRKMFERIWKEYPKRSGAKGNKDSGYKLCCGIAKTEDDWRNLFTIVKKYKAWAEGTGSIGTATVQQFTTFFGKAKAGYKEDWEITGNENRKTGSISSNEKRAELTNKTLEAGLRAAAKRKQREANGSDGRTVCSNAAQEASSGELILSDRGSQADSEGGVWSADQGQTINAEDGGVWN